MKTPTLKPIKPVWMSPHDLIADLSIQFRPEKDEAVIEEYAEAMKGGAKFPPIIAYGNDEGTFISDGFTRRDAGILAKKKVLVEVREGGRIEAKFNALSENDTHGQRLNRAGKRNKIKAMLTDPDVNIDPKTGKVWSDTSVGNRCNVSPHTVAKVRQELADDTMQLHSMDSDERAFVHHRTGEVTTMKTANIGAVRATPFKNGDRVTWHSRDGSEQFGIFRSTKTGYPDQAEIEREDGNGWYSLQMSVLAPALSDREIERQEVIAEKNARAAREEYAKWDGEDKTETAVTESAAPVPGSSDGEYPADEPGTTPEETEIQLDGESAPVTNNAAPESSTSDDSKTDSSEAEKPKEPTIKEKVEALPLYQALALHGHGAQLFREQALIYHNVEKIINSARAKKTLLEYKTGPISDAISTVAKLPSPELWEGCATCKGSDLKCPSLVFADTPEVVSRQVDVCPFL